MKPIRFTPYATDPDVQAMILGNLPEPALLEMMSAKAKDQNHGWLQTMLDGDLLGLEDDLQNFHMLQNSGDHDGASMHLMQEIPRWSRRAIAMTAFTQNVQVQDQTLDDSTTVMKLATYGPNQGSSAELKCLVAEGCAQVGKAYESMSKGIGMAHAVNHNGAMKLAMTHWMVAACVMDLPDSLERLVKACPLALRATIPLDEVSESMMQVFRNKVEKRNGDGPSYVAPEAQVTPFFVALQLSRMQCMDVMIPLMVKEVDANIYMGQQKGGGERAPVYLHSMETLTGFLCKPEALTRALAHSFDTALEFISAPRDCTNKQKMFNAAMAAMENTSRWERPYVQSYMDAGILDRDPAQAIKTACAAGHPDVIEHFRGRVPWEFIENTFTSGHSTLYRAANATNDDAETLDRHEQAVARLLDLAIEDGQNQCVFQTFTVTTGLFAKIPEPVSSMAEKGWASVIVRYLDNGFDPKAKTAGSTLTLMEVVEENAPDMAKVIHAHQARKKARAVLDEIDLPSTPSFKS